MNENGFQANVGRVNVFANFSRLASQPEVSGVVRDTKLLIMQTRISLIE